ncbi:O-antigen ligase family protein [Nitrospira lenta]|uniref:O-antigen ligase-related domain-containing protein n=1 Tax=Nitrospira lenta TaxID=1436998 RepID=A0A330L2B7_9BACT|nr:O-antigen ligase family protein [Nitrospira lenta]SPP62992.1 membrane hypothetical protein [Nitrospira lenta]
MLIAFALLIVALLAKDATPLGDRFVLRALSEGTALVVGGGWLALSGGRIFNRWHLVLGLYFAALVFAIPQVASPWFVSLQVLALAAILLFALAFLDAAKLDVRQPLLVARTMLIALTVVCLVSLLLRVWYPAFTFEQTFEGPRFRGVFSKPAMMGAASGLLLGLCLFVPWHWSIRAVGIAASLPCLFLTGSRTFWVAAVVSMGAMGIRYVRWSRTFVPMVAALIVAVLCLGIVVGTQVTSEQRAKIFRQGSLENLSGRTAMWTQALERYWEHPWLGYGFTAGGVVLSESGWRGTGSASSNSPSQGAVTLHNGYVQALLDSGGIGAALYVAVIVSALLCFLRYDGAKQYAAEFYCLLFLAIANLGETVIFGAAVLHGVWFWYVTVLALTLPSLASPVSSPVQADSLNRETPLEVETERVSSPATPEPRRFPLVQSREAWR